LTGNDDHGRQPTSSCSGREIVETAIETLDDALNRLRAYCDVLDWMFVHPPDEPELMCMTLDEIRRALSMAISARDILLRQQHGST